MLISRFSGWIADNDRVPSQVSDGSPLPTTTETIYWRAARHGERERVWGEQLDVREIAAFSVDAEFADQAVAAYVAKYATKSADASGTLDRALYCRPCQGRGATLLPHATPLPCTTCDGTGQIPAPAPPSPATCLRQEFLTVRKHPVCMQAIRNGPRGNHPPPQDPPSPHPTPYRINTPAPSASSSEGPATSPNSAPEASSGWSGRMRTV
ncbi:replication initiator [Streptomyces bobili]